MCASVPDERSVDYVPTRDAEVVGEDCVNDIVYVVMVVIRISDFG